MVTLLDALRAWTVLFGIHVANATRGFEIEILVLLWYLLAAVGVALAASERGRGFLIWTVAALTTGPQLALAWGFVGIPLAWGVLQTLSNALTLFK
jgi:hypothetical protein